MGSDEQPTKLTHLDEHGRAAMVDVGHKHSTARRATARVFVFMDAQTLEAVAQQRLAKGEALQVARIAGIMAAKRTDELIPLCHSLGLDHVEVRFALIDAPTALLIEATASCQGKTGVEMEAMSAASIAALTVYDMVKGVDKGVTIEHLHLWEKTGGKSGDFKHPKSPGPALDEAALAWR